MRKTVLTFGLIQGVVLSAVLLLVTLPFHDEIGYDLGMLVGYTSMVIAGLLIFFGVRSYRDNVAGGSVGFFRALAVGVLIGAVAGVCYVVTWELVQERYASDFMKSYQVHVLEKARADGESENAIAQRKIEMDKWAEMYRNPAIRAAMTFAEPLPVTLIMALLSAGILSRRRRGAEGSERMVRGAHVPT